MVQVPGMISSNWTIIIGLTGSLFVTLIGVYLTNRFLQGRITSAEEERRNQAKDEVLNILENSLINSKSISEEKIKNVLRAADREHKVSISENTSPIALLQDLELRIEKSRHLDPEQKENYTKKIEELVKQLREEDTQQDIPSSYDELVKALRDEISDENGEAIKKLDQLEEKLGIDNPPREIVTPLDFYMEVFRNPADHRRLLVITLVIYTLLAAIYFGWV